jgi:hypothetical protein
MKRQQTRELEYKHHPRDKEVVLTIEVSRGGDIVSASELRASDDEWVDCTEAVQSSEKWSKWVEENFGDIDWDDDGDQAYEGWKDQSLSLILGALVPVS